MQAIILLLTCKDDQEADTISKVLLEKKLIVCAKKTPVASSFYWRGGIDRGNEILLIMDSIEDLFTEIEEEVKKLHSYKTFVLTALPVSKASTGVAEWMREGLKST